MGLFILYSKEYIMACPAAPRRAGRRGCRGGHLSGRPRRRGAAPAEWVNGWMSEWVGEWVSEWVSGWVSEWFEWVSEWEGGWVSEWVSKWVSEWEGGWVSEWVSGWVSEWVSEWAVWVSEWFEWTSGGWLKLEWNDIFCCQSTIYLLLIYMHISEVCGYVCLLIFPILFINLHFKNIN